MRVPYEWWKKSAVLNNRVGHHENTLNQLDGTGTRQLLVRALVDGDRRNRAFFCDDSGR